MGKLTKLTVLAVLVRRFFRYVNRSFGWLFSKFRVPKAVVTKQHNSRLTKFQRHLITNMVVGLFIAIALHFMQHSAYLTQLEDTALDWTMQMYRGTVPKDEVTPVAFIDIDDESYLAWGEQLITPRDKLARLIKHAMESKAKAIVIDIDLSRSSTTGDEQLVAVLAEYQASEKELDIRLPPLVLTRVFKPHSLREKSTSLNQERISFLDSIVSKSSNIYWAMSVYDLELDGKVRNWHLWQAVCDQNQTPVIYPSVQLLVKVLLTENTNLVAELYDRLQQMAPSQCDVNQQTSASELEDSFSKSASININAEEFNLQQNQTGRRIIYRMPWILQQGEKRPDVLINDSQSKQIKVPQLSRRSAALFTENDQKASAEWLDNHLVIIGASHADSRDLYQTPIGLMPGALIIANAIQSFDSHGELRTPGLIETLLLEAFLIAVMSYLFARFDSFIGSLLAGAIVMLTLLPLSLWLFNSGYWLSFAIPLLAIYIHELAADLEEIIGQHKSKESSHV